MDVQKLRSALTVALMSVFIVVVVFGGTAFAQKKKADSEGWLGVYIQEVDEDLQDAWDLDTDDGVLIDDVIDDSPAEEAGLEPGDVILEYDGRTVTTSGRLTRWIRHTDPDTKVTLKIARDGDPMDIDVVIGEADDEDFLWWDGDDTWSFHTPRVHVPRPHIPRIQVFGDDDDGFLITSYDHAHIGVELHDLNRQLMEYFGVEGGALIDEVEDGSPAEEAGLKAGDVIIEIDGREMDEAADVIDEVIDHDDGDQIEVVVMRNKSRQTFTVTVEEDDQKSRGLRIRTPRAPKSKIVRGIYDHDWDWDENEFQEELQEAMEELREELEEMRKELQEELEDIRRGR